MTNNTFFLNIIITFTTATLKVPSLRRFNCRNWWVSRSWWRCPLAATIGCSCCYRLVILHVIHLSIDSSVISVSSAWHRRACWSSVFFWGWWRWWWKLHSIAWTIWWWWSISLFNWINLPKRDLSSTFILTFTVTCLWFLVTSTDRFIQVDYFVIHAEIIHGLI